MWTNEPRFARSNVRLNMGVFIFTLFFFFFNHEGSILNNIWKEVTRASLKMHKNKS